MPVQGDLELARALQAEFKGGGSDRDRGGRGSRRGGGSRGGNQATPSQAGHGNVRAMPRGSNNTVSSVGRGVSRVEVTRPGQVRGPFEPVMQPGLRSSQENRPGRYGGTPGTLQSTNGTNAIAGNDQNRNTPDSTPSDLSAPQPAVLSQRLTRSVHPPSKQLNLMDDDVPMDDLPALALPLTAMNSVEPDWDAFLNEQEKKANVNKIDDANEATPTVGAASQSVLLESYPSKTDDSKANPSAAISATTSAKNGSNYTATPTVGRATHGLSPESAPFVPGNLKSKPASIMSAKANAENVMLPRPTKPKKGLAHSRWATAD